MAIASLKSVLLETFPNEMPYKTQVSIEYWDIHPSGRFQNRNIRLGKTYRRSYPFLRSSQRRVPDHMPYCPNSTHFHWNWRSLCCNIVSEDGIGTAQFIPMRSQDQNHSYIYKTPKARRQSFDQ